MLSLGYYRQIRLERISNFDFSNICFYFSLFAAFLSAGPIVQKPRGDGKYVVFTFKDTSTCVFVSKECTVSEFLKSLSKEEVCDWKVNTDL